MKISRRELANAVDARLADVAFANHYRGEVPADTPVIDDSDGRVRAYTVTYPSPGTPTDDPDLGEQHEDLRWLIQITCAAGYPDDALALIDRVVARLQGWAPTIAGVECSRLKPPSGYDPGPLRRDDDVSPPRYFTPLLYALTATT